MYVCRAMCIFVCGGKSFIKILFNFSDNPKRFYRSYTLTNYTISRYASVISNFNPSHCQRVENKKKNACPNRIFQFCSKSQSQSVRIQLLSSSDKVLISFWNLCRRKKGIRKISIKRNCLWTEWKKITLTNDWVPK